MSSFVSVTLQYRVRQTTRRSPFQVQINTMTLPDEITQWDKIPFSNHKSSLQCKSTCQARNDTRSSCSRSRHPDLRKRYRYATFLFLMLKQLRNLIKIDWWDSPFICDVNAMHDDFCHNQEGVSADSENFPKERVRSLDRSLKSPESWAPRSCASSGGDKV